MLMPAARCVEPVHEIPTKNLLFKEIPNRVQGSECGNVRTTLVLIHPVHHGADQVPWFAFIRNMLPKCRELALTVSCFGEIRFGVLILLFRRVTEL